MFERDDSKEYKLPLKSSKHIYSTSQVALEKDLGLKIQLHTDPEDEQTALRERGLRGLRLDSTKSCALQTNNPLLEEFEDCN
jgi:hypothetical protein